MRCDESIGTTPFPYLGNNKREYQYRVVLGAASVPPAYLNQVVATRQPRWPYWRKAGLVIRSGAKGVTLTVPNAWRDHAAILWGNGGRGPFSAVRIAECGSNPHSGNAYAGGFYLRSPTACVPLVVSNGTRTTTIRFGIGRRCP